MEHSMNGHQRRLERMANTHTLKNACNEDIKPYEIVAPPAEIVYGPLPEFGTFCDVHYSVAVALKRDHVSTVMYTSQRKYSFFLPPFPLSSLCQACNGSNNPYSRNALFTVNCGKRNAGETPRWIFVELFTCAKALTCNVVGKVIERVCVPYTYMYRQDAFIPMKKNGTVSAYL